MSLRLLVVVSCLGLASACATDEAPYSGSGSGAGSLEDVHHTSLQTLKLTSDLAVVGTITSVSAGLSGTTPETTVSMSVAQTLWAAPGVAPTSIAFSYTSDGDASHAPVEGEDAIVFLTATGTGKFLVSGGATGRFRVVEGVVAPVANDGVALPANTDVAGFAALLSSTPTETPVDLSGVIYGSGY
jgi:hypothetical protein